MGTSIFGYWSNERAACPGNRGVQGTLISQALIKVPLGGMAHQEAVLVGWYRNRIMARGKIELPFEAKSRARAHTLRK